MDEQWIPEKGDRFVAAQDYFGKVCTVSRRTKVKGRIFIYDEAGQRYPIDQCHQYNPERPLSDDELKTMIDVCEAVAEAGDVEYLAMLEDLTIEQKQQVWVALSPELQQALKKLRGKPTQPKPIAPSTAPLVHSEGLRTIIAGSRTITDYSLVEQAILDSGFKISVVLSGEEPNGVDHLGEVWAEKNGVPVEGYPALWKKHGRAAGPIRNKEMIVEGKAEALILVWLGDRKVSPGSFDMLAQAIEHDLQIYQVNLSQQPIEVVA